MTTDRDLDLAMGALNQKVSEYQRGIGTYGGKLIEFPRFRAPETYTLLTAMCGFGEAEAKRTVRELVDQRRLVRSGESTATEYTTAAIHDAEIAKRIEDRKRVNEVIGVLIRLGVLDPACRPITYRLTDSNGIVHRAYAQDNGHFGPLILTWTQVELLLQKTGHLDEVQS